MLASYLKQKAQYEPKTGNDGRGGSIYGPAETVDCRREYKLQEVLLPDCSTIRSEYTYYLIREVKEGDCLDGRRVRLAVPMVGLPGEPLGYKAVT